MCVHERLCVFLNKVWLICYVSVWMIQYFHWRQRDCGKASVELSAGCFFFFCLPGSCLLWKCLTVNRRGSWRKWCRRAAVLIYSVYLRSAVFACVRARVCCMCVCSVLVVCLCVMCEQCVHCILSLFYLILLLQLGNNPQSVRNLILKPGVHHLLPSLSVTRSRKSNFCKQAAAMEGDILTWLHKKASWCNDYLQVWMLNYLDNIKSNQFVT